MAKHTGIDDGPPNSIIKCDFPRRAKPVPDSIIGNILDHWDMLPGDVRDYVKEGGGGFYGAMERLTDWIQENQ